MIEIALQHQLQLIQGKHCVGHHFLCQRVFGGLATMLANVTLGVVTELVDRPLQGTEFCDNAKRHVGRSEEHTSELQSRPHLVCRLLLEKKKKNYRNRRDDESYVQTPLH